MAIQVYNTLTNQKEKFETSEPGKVKMYVCGPTVYDLLHIGNFRGPIFFNLVRNWLEFTGHEVTYAYNYTDVDDKIIKRANDEGVDSSVISERYIEEFKKDYTRLGLKPHDHNPKVTETIPEIIAIVEKLIANGKAYEVDGEVFYDITQFSHYGELSGKKLEDLNAGQRVEVDQRKKNPGDFVLWKPSKEGEPKWDSPWGQGRPGWHIECSAMIDSIFHGTIDIHGGGIDLIFPHHENEIAQGEGAHECKYCRYWMHNNFINMDNEKMSKSLGNVIKGREFMDRYHPEILKYMFLSVHYRRVLGVGDEKISQTISALQRVYTAKNDAQLVVEAFEGAAGNPDGGFKKLLEQSDNKIKKSLNDDFNTSEFIAIIFEAVRSFNALNITKKKPNADKKATSEMFINWLNKYGDMSGLFSLNPSEFLKELDEILMRMKNIDRSQVEELISQRRAAREGKDWAKSDEIRDQLSAMGIELYDGASSGREWSVKAD
jgi:cysteinyl-tRNA synthetase